MAKFFLSTWDWLKDADNRALLGWIGGGIAALATAIWVVYTHFASTKQGGSQPNGWIEYGIRAGGDIRASGDIIQGLSPVQVQKIIATFNTAEVERISEELGVAKAAVLNFFRIIGQQNALITVEEFDAKLCEIALRHKAFQAEIATIQPDDPVVLEAKNKAATAAEQGDYNLAEKFLQDALSRDLTAAQQLSVVTDKRLISAAKTRGELGLLKLAELRFSDAAEDFLEAADLVPTTYPILHSEYINRAITAYANAVESNVETLHELAEAFDRGLIILKGVAGIGIAVEKAPDTEGLKITSVKPNMPAAAAGILEGDILVSLNGKAIRNKKLEESLASMRGSAGTAVSITLLRGDQQRQLILKRAPLAKVEPGRQKDMVNGTAGLHDLAVSLQQQLVSETKSLLAMRNDTPNLRITYNVAVRITNLQSILSDAHGRTSALVEQILSAKPSASQLFQRINKLLSKCREECGNLGSEAAALDQELEDLKLRNQISDIDEDLLNLGVSMLGTLDSLQIALKLNPRLFDEVSAR